MIKEKKTKIIICVMLTVFLAWNFIWAMHYFNLKSYTENIPSDGDGGYVTSDTEENSYSVKVPNYLRFNGNLAVIDENSNSLIIWVSLFDVKTYGVQIYIEGFQTYDMLLDENGQLLEMGNLEDAPEMYNANKEIIDKLYAYANNFWELK